MSSPASASWPYSHFGTLSPPSGLVDWLFSPPSVCSRQISYSKILRHPLAVPLMASFLELGMEDAVSRTDRSFRCWLSLPRSRLPPLSALLVPEDLTTLSTFFSFSSSLECLSFVPLLWDDTLMSGLYGCSLFCSQSFSRRYALVLGSLRWLSPVLSLLCFFFCFTDLLLPNPDSFSRLLLAGAPASAVLCRPFLHFPLFHVFFLVLDGSPLVHVLFRDVLSYETGF